MIQCSPPKMTPKRVNTTIRLVAVALCDRSKERIAVAGPSGLSLLLDAMVHVQQLQIEIQKLKEELDASQKKANRYSELGAYGCCPFHCESGSLMSAVTTLYDELDKLRRNICHDCKKRLAVHGNVSGPAPAISSTSTPFWRRVFQTRPHRPALNIASGRTSSPEISGSTVPTIALITSETIPDATADAPTTNSGPEPLPAPISPEPKSEPPEFSVDYNPEVKRTLALHLEHVFAHEYPANCVKMSPDGQRIAVGFQDSGATIISDLKTRSNVRSVSECLFSSLN